MSNYSASLNLWQARKKLVSHARQKKIHQTICAIAVILIVGLISACMGIIINTRAATTNFRLSIAAGAVVCDNGVVDGTEVCDEGAALNGTPNHCNDDCSGNTTPVCGNSVKESGETCDDGNTASGDGCSSSCQTEVITPPVETPSVTRGNGPPNIIPYLSWPTIPTLELPVNTKFSFVFRLLDALQNNTIIQSFNFSEQQDAGDYIITTNRPIFSGTVSEPKAILRFTLHSDNFLYGLVTADSAGNWRWDPQATLEPGWHELLVTVFSADGQIILGQDYRLTFFIGSDAEYRQYIESQKPTLGPEIPSENIISIKPLLEQSQKEVYLHLLYDLGLEVADKISVGQPLDIGLTLRNYDAKKLGALTAINFTLTNEQGEIVSSQSRTLAVSEFYTYQIRLLPQVNLPVGNYRLTASLAEGATIVMAYDDFTVLPSQMITIGRTSFPILGVLQTLAGALALFLIILLLEFRYLRNLGRLAHALSEEDLKQLGYIT